MDENVKQKLLDKSKWIRLIFMIVFGVVNYFVQIVICFIAVVQFVCSLLTGKPIKNLLTLGEGLSAFSYQIMQYLVYHTENKPYPFGDWPGASDKTVKKVKMESQKKSSE